MDTMNKKCRLAVILATALLASCAHQQKVSFGEFPTNEYSALKKEGTATIDGQLFLKTRGGDVKYGAGSEILLIPVTSYSATLYRAVKANQPLEEADPRVREYTRRTQADGLGNFSYKHVAPGKYYIGGNVTWEAPTQFGLAQQGGLVLREITVGDGEEVKAIVTQ
jgi:hypothetical protein